MAGHDDLRRGGHAHGIAPQDAGGPDLCRGLILRPVAVEVDPLPQRNAQLLGRLAGQLPEAGGVQMGGVGESDPELGQIFPPERRLGKHLDVVGNEHQVPGLPAGVDASGGIGDDQGVTPQQAQHPDGVGHLLIGVALVVVRSALHDRHPLPLQSAEDQPPLVSRRGGCLKVGNIQVVDGDGTLHLVPHIA